MVRVRRGSKGGRKVKEMEGVYGSYRVIKYVGSSYWLCECIGCGLTTRVLSWHLRRGEARSCRRCSDESRIGKPTVATYRKDGLKFRLRALFYRMRVDGGVCAEWMTRGGLTLFHQHLVDIYGREELSKLLDSGCKLTKLREEDIYREGNVELR